MHWIGATNILEYLKHMECYIDWSLDLYLVFTVSEIHIHVYTAHKDPYNALKSIYRDFILNCCCL